MFLPEGQEGLLLGQQFGLEPFTVLQIAPGIGDLHGLAGQIRVDDRRVDIVLAARGRAVAQFGGRPLDRSPAFRTCLARSWF